MWLGMSLLLPVGGLVAFFGDKSSSKWFHIHRFVQAFAFVVVLTSLVIIENKKTSEGMPHAETNHEVQLLL